MRLLELLLELTLWVEVLLQMLLGMALRVELLELALRGELLLGAVIIHRGIRRGWSPKLRSNCAGSAILMHLCWQRRCWRKLSLHWCIRALVAWHHKRFLREHLLKLHLCWQRLCLHRWRLH